MTDDAVEDVFDLGPDVEGGRDDGDDGSGEDGGAGTAGDSTSERDTAGGSGREDDRPTRNGPRGERSTAGKRGGSTAGKQGGATGGTGGGRARRAAEAGKAMTTEDVQSRPFYALPETWEALDDFVQFEVRRALADRGIRDATKNEISDAIAQTVLDHAAEVADQVVDRRVEPGTGREDA